MALLKLVFWKGKGQIPFFKVYHPSTEKPKALVGFELRTEPELGTGDSHSTSTPPLYSPLLQDSRSRSIYHLTTLRLDQEISFSSVAKRSWRKPRKEFMLCENGACTCVYMSSSIRVLCLNVFGCWTSSHSICQE